MPRFSANLGFLWNDRPLLERIDAAARAGFRAVELHWPYDVPAEEVKQACERNRLTVLGLNTDVGEGQPGSFGLAAQPGREDEFRAALDQSVAYCRASGATAIHVMPGTVGGARSEAEAVFLRNLENSAEAAAEHGLTILLEPINPRDKPGYFYSRVEEAAEIIRRLGRDNIRLMFDVYHVAISEGDVLTRLERHMPLIGHVQIAAVPSRAEPDEGEIAYGAIFDALDRFGYDGWVGCEYHPRAAPEDGLGWIETLGVRL